METNELVKALCAAQADVHSQAKDSANKYHGYKYVAMEDLVIEARRVLGLHGLAATIGDVTLDRTAGAESDVATFACTLRHASGQAVSCVRQQYVLPEKGRPPDKALATANTFALGYWLRDLLLIPRVDDEPDKRDDTAYQPASRKTLAPRFLHPQEPAPSAQSTGPVPASPPRTPAQQEAAPVDEKTFIIRAQAAIAKSPSVADALKLGKLIRDREKDGIFSAKTAEALLTATLSPKLYDLARWTFGAAKSLEEVQDVIGAITRAVKSKIVDPPLHADILKLGAAAMARLEKTPVEQMEDFFDGAEEVAE